VTVDYSGGRDGDVRRDQAKDDGDAADGGGGGGEEASAAAGAAACEGRCVVRLREMAWEGKVEEGRGGMVQGVEEVLISNWSRKQKAFAGRLSESNG
jgi:hypothetical protein